MGNFSKNPQIVFQDALQKGYSRVRFQQGKPLLDRELNLLGDLADPQQLKKYYVGNGVPEVNNGFQISALDVINNDFTIQAGRCMVGGYEVVLASDTTYKTQPHREHIAALPGGTSRVYLRVFVREVPGTEDPDLLNNADVGFETAVREKIEWEVLVSAAEIPSTDHFLLAEINTTNSTVRDRRRTGLNVAAIRDNVAAIRDEVTSARGTANNLNGRLNVSLNPDGTLKANSIRSAQIADKSVSFSKLDLTEVFKGSITIMPNANFDILLRGVKKHAYLFISAVITGTSGGPSGEANISWNEYFATSITEEKIGRGIRIKNESGLKVQVDVIVSAYV